MSKEAMCVDRMCALNQALKKTAEDLCAIGYAKDCNGAGLNLKKAYDKLENAFLTAIAEEDKLLTFLQAQK